MKKLIAMLLALAMVLSLAACGAKEEPAPAPAEPDAPVVEVTEPAEMADPSSITRGGTLIVAKQKAMDKGMNFTQDSDVSSSTTVYGTMYETLIGIDAAGNMIPSLATEWTWSEDALCLTLKLRDDVSFSNGEKFNAEAAAKCINYYISEECGHTFKSSDLAVVTDAVVVDEYTVAINLSAVDSGLCKALTATAGLMAAPSVIDAKFDCDPVGTGPFVLEEYKEGESVSVKANPNYYKMGEDGKPLPYLDGIQFLFITDDTTAITNLKAGSVHGIDRLSSTTSVFTAQGMDTVSLYQNPVTNCYTVSMNLLDETVRNDKLREAIACAIDSEEILEIAMEGLANNTGFWTDSAKWYFVDYNPHVFDVEKAKALMKEAGYENGVDLELSIIAREPDNTCAQLIQAQLAKIGINLTISATDSATFVQYVRNDHKSQLAINLVGNAGYEPTKSWTIPLKSFGDVGTGIDMIDHLNDLIQATKTETDDAKRLALIEEFQKTVLDQNLSFIMGHKYQYGTFQNDLHGAAFGFWGFWDFANAWMEA